MMNASDSPAPAPGLPLHKLVCVTGSYVRLLMLREYVRQRQPMGPLDISRAVGISAGAAQKHLSEMRDLGVLVQGFGRLYSLAPQWMPPPGSLHVDFGICLVRLDLL